jgi:predicted transcriptional regulator
MSEGGRDNNAAEGSRKRYAISQEPELIEDIPSNKFESFRDEVQALVPDNVPLLAAVLLEQGVLDQAKLAKVLERQVETGESLAAVMFELGVVGADRLITALQYRSSYR